MPPRALRPAAVPDDRHATGTPAGSSAFSLAVTQVEAGIAAVRAARPEVSFDGEPPPRRLAPQAIAIAATVEIADAEIGAGRFVLLYDPAGQEGWAGPFGSSPTCGPSSSRRSPPISSSARLAGAG